LAGIPVAFRRAYRTVEEVHQRKGGDDVRDGVDTTEAGRQDLGRHCCCYRHSGFPLDLHVVEVDLRRLLAVLRNEDETSCGEDAVVVEDGEDGGGQDANNEEAVEVRRDPCFPGIRTVEEVRKDPMVAEDTGRHCCHWDHWGCRC
jgi:hypothetical protein